MKDYTIAIEDKEERERYQEKFILGYEVKEKKDGKKRIIISYANGSEGHIEYSKAFEKCILYLMECQIKKYESRMQKFERNYKTRVNSLNLENRLGILAIAVIVLIGMMSTVSFGMSFLGAIVLIFLLGDLVVDVSKIIKQKRIINNFDKMLLFTQNDERINKNILDRDNKFIKEISSILDKVCVDLSDNQRGITVNSLDKISLKKLEKIVNNIKLKEREQELIEKREMVLAKGREIERQVKKRRPFESLLTIEDVARLRSVDELNYQYRLNDENKSSFIDVRDRYSSSLDFNKVNNHCQIKRRVKKVKK